MSGRSLRLLVVACLLLATAGLVATVVGSRSTTVEAQTRQVASTLRCPACVGEDVADSTSPVAASMRTAVAEQLAAGRSPAEVREWFADRYGDDVLLDPPPRGPALLLWVAPAVLLAAAAVALVRAPGAARTGAPTLAVVGVGVMVVTVAVWGAGASGAGDAAAVPSAPATGRSGEGAVLRSLADSAPGDGALQLAAARATDTEGQVADALPYYAAAARLDPFGTVPNYLHASALVRTDARDEAVRVLEQVVTTDPGHAPSVLLLGTLLQRAGEPRGEALLREFLGLVDEEHPAAEDVRQLLAQESTTGAGP